MDAQTDRCIRVPTETFAGLNQRVPDRRDLTGSPAVPHEEHEPPFFLRSARTANAAAVRITTVAAAQDCQSAFMSGQKPRSLPPW